MSDNAAAPIASVALVGPGRAGTALAAALTARDVQVTAVAGRSPDAASTRNAAAMLHAPAVPVDVAGRGADLVIVATPDDAIESVASAVAVSLEPGSLVIHLSGARGLDALAPIVATRHDVHIGALHPLQTLPSADVGAARLAGSWAAVAGPTRVDDVARFLDLHPLRVSDERRAVYHAAACIAANHLVALLAQVQRVASEAGVPLEAFEPLVRASVDNVFALGPAAALTGPVTRGDVGTVADHLDALPEQEHDAYRALADAARRLADLDDDAMRSLLAAHEGASA